MSNNKDSTLCRVLMFAYAVDRNDIGEAQLTFRWIEQISKQVHITLITGGSRLHETCGLEDNPNISLVKIKPSITFRWTGAFDRVFKPDYIELYARARAAAKRLVQTEQFHSLHHIAPHSPRYPSPLHNLHSNFYIGPIHGGLALPKNFVAKTVKTRLASFLRSAEGLRNRHDRLLLASMKSARSLLISAPYMKDTLPQQFRDKCLVIPPQPPDQAGSNQKRAELKTPVKLLFVGRLIENKGIRYAIEALQHIPASDYQLTIYGSGEQETMLKEMVAHFGMAQCVQFKGFAEHADVLEAMGRHDIFLFPSLKEAWGLVVAEAMQAGLPVICADRGGPGYMIDESCGMKVATESPEQFVRDITSALKALIYRPDLIKQMSVAATKRAESQFSWPVLTQKLLELYTK